MELSIIIGLFILGTIFGSFYNVVAYRLPKGESILYPGSHCPKCNHKLSVLAQNTIKPLLDNEQKSIYEKRKFKLILKNVDNFVSLDINDISPTQNYKVAGRIVELKINNFLDDENIKVCKTQSPELDATLYLVMYDEGEKVRVDIVNFTDRLIPSFIFVED